MPTQAQIESDIRHSIEDELDAHLSRDPTRNVREIVWQESKYQDAMRKAEAKYANAIRQAEVRRLEELSNAETRRVNDLDVQRVRYEARIAEDLRVNVKTTSDQLAGQLVKETGALNNQIVTLNTSFTNQFATLSAALTNQISSMTVGINTRLADLEKFKWETGGRSSEADPAMKMALAQMTQQIGELKEVATRGVGRQEQVVAEKLNYNLIIGWIVAASAIVGLIIKWH